MLKHKTCFVLPLAKLENERETFFTEDSLLKNS